MVGMVPSGIQSRLALLRVVFVRFSVVPLIGFHLRLRTQLWVGTPPAWGQCKTPLNALPLPLPPKLKKRAPKVGGFAAHFACGFVEFWKGGTRSRIVFEVFVRWPLMLSDGNN